MRTWMKFIASVAVTGFIASVAVTGFAVIGGSVSSGAAARAVDDTEQPGIVEDFSYPGAAAIQAAKGISLISGDGHIMLAECGSADNLIRVESYSNINEPVYCFRVLGTKGLLTLHIEKVFFVWAGDTAVTATITINGRQQPPVVVPANDGEPVGYEDPANHAILLELRVG